MKVQLGKTWMRKLKVEIQGFDMEVGILKDKPHRLPEPDLLGVPQLTKYAGEPVQRASMKPSGRSVGDIFMENMTRMNINLLQRPFKEKDSDILKFTESFLKLVLKRPGISIKRVENLLQAIVRNPILKKEYGSNSPVTADIKGFDRLLFGTGQMFKTITAKVQRRV